MIFGGTVESIHMSDATKQSRKHKTTQNNKQQRNEDSDVVDDARFGKRFAHHQRNDADDAEKRPHAQARKHADVERAGHARLEFALLDEFVLSRPKGEVVGDEAGQHRKRTGREVHENRENEAKNKHSRERRFWLLPSNA